MKIQAHQTSCFNSAYSSTHQFLPKQPFYYGKLFDQFRKDLSLTMVEKPYDSQKAKESFYHIYQTFLKEEGLLEIVQADKQALLTQVGGPEHLESYEQAIGYSGGKDGSAAFLEEMFLNIELEKEYGKTFHLTVGDVLQAGSTYATTLGNMDRLFKATGAYNNPSVSLVMLVDGKKIPFDIHSPYIQKVRERDRRRFLFLAHLTHGDPRMTYCLVCNGQTTNDFRSMLNPNSPELKTGDSETERRYYTNWVVDASKRLAENPQEILGTEKRFDRLLAVVEENLFQHILFEDHEAFKVPVPPKKTIFRKAFNKMPYSYEINRKVMEKLGYQLDPQDPAVSGSESDCFNPADMVQKWSTMYSEIGHWFTGIRKNRFQAMGFYYQKHLRPLMIRKGMPQQMIEINDCRYQNFFSMVKEAFRTHRIRREIYDISSQQEMASLWSPFTESGKYLGPYLKARAAHLQHRESDIHRLLNSERFNNEAEDTHLQQQLEQLSGLNLRDLRILYGWFLIMDPFVGKTPKEVVSKLKKPEPKMELKAFTVMEPYAGVYDLRDNSHASGLEAFLLKLKTKTDFKNKSITQAEQLEKSDFNPFIRITGR